MLSQPILALTFELMCPPPRFIVWFGHVEIASNTLDNNMPLGCILHAMGRLSRLHRSNRVSNANSTLIPQ